RQRAVVRLHAGRVLSRAHRSGPRAARRNEGCARQRRTRERRAAAGDRPRCRAVVRRAEGQRGKVRQARRGELTRHDHADNVRRGQVFLLDRGPRGGAVLRVEEPALLGEDHPAIAPPIRQHAVIVDQVVALLGGEQARMRLVERIEPGVILERKQLVAEIIRGVAPDRHADRVELAIELIVVDRLAPRDLVQSRQRAGEIRDAGESELIEGDGGHVVLAKAGRP
ncbi:hypothetical protein chiPu_0030907, partial [Chiloscyllium punctatum]|nr:hypothetical protein [Chiloscyllium punctatum]